MWGGMFSVCDCTLVAIRGKEDPFNSIASGFLTGGLLQIRRKYFEMTCLFDDLNFIL